MPMLSYEVVCKWQAVDAAAQNDQLVQMSALVCQPAIAQHLSLIAHILGTFVGNFALLLTLRMRRTLALRSPLLVLPVLLALLSPMNPLLCLLLFSCIRDMPSATDSASLLHDGASTHQNHTTLTVMA